MKRVAFVVVIIAILILTLQTPEQSQAVSSAIQKIILRFVDYPWIRNMQTFRTVLHAPLYFLLGLAVGAWRKKWWHAAIICSLIALAFGALDLLFDAVGFMIAIGIVS